jgi:F-type H+-transporting ATPase subunit b
MPPRRLELAMAQKSAQALESVEHIPSTEHGRGFPPFDSTTFASQLLWLALTFIALYLLMSRVALPRIGSILEARRQRVDGDLAEAQRLKDQSDAAIAAHEKALAEARGRAQALANDTREKAAAAAEARRKEVDAKLNARIAEAEKTIAATRSAAMANVHSVASDTVPAIVERLIGIAPESKDVAEAVSNVLKR